MIPIDESVQSVVSLSFLFFFFLEIGSSQITVGVAD